MIIVKLIYINIYYRNKVFQNNQKQNKGETIEVNASFV